MALRPRPAAPPTATDSYKQGCKLGHDASCTSFARTHARDASKATTTPPKAPSK